MKNQLNDATFKRLRYKILTKMKQTIALFLFGLISVSASGYSPNMTVDNSSTVGQNEQTETITGKVIDDEGSPLPGVTVVVEGTTTGGITDVEGMYSVEATSDDHLIFTFIGFHRQVIAVGNKASDCCSTTDGFNRS